MATTTWYFDAHTGRILCAGCAAELRAMVPGVALRIATERDVLSPTHGEDCAECGREVHLGDQIAAAA